ncbi:MAG: hypothetical protein AAF773_08555 [Cyanobacteria bacterium P01_D01_bin.115]
MLTREAPSRRFNAAVRKILYGLLMCLVVSQPTKAGSDTAQLLPIGHRLDGLPAKPLSPSSQDQVLRSFEQEIEPRLLHHGLQVSWFYQLVEDYASRQNDDGQRLADSQKLAIANTLLHRLLLTLSAESLQCLGCQHEVLPLEAQVVLAQSPNPTQHYAAADDRFQAVWPALGMDETLGTHWDDVRLALLADELLEREPTMAPTDATDY